MRLGTTALLLKVECGREAYPNVTRCTQGYNLPIPIGATSVVWAQYYWPGHRDKSAKLLIGKSHQNSPSFGKLGCFVAPHKTELLVWIINHFIVSQQEITTTKSNMKSTVRFMLTSFLLFGLASANEIIVRNVFDQQLAPVDVLAIEEAGAIWLDAVEGAGGGLRNLRGSDRDLQVYQCNYWCVGFPCGMCYIWKPQCWNWCPRRLEEGEEAPPMPSNVRKLNTANEVCQQKIDEALLIMQTAVSRQGEPIVDASQFNCYEIIDDPEEGTCKGIENWNMWDSQTSQVTHANFRSGTRLCQSEMPTKNLQSSVSASCAVEQVGYVMSGPGGLRYSHTERNALYFLFGNRGEDVGQSLNTWPAGDYTVTAVVKLSDGAGIKPAAPLTFTVDGSC